MNSYGDDISLAKNQENLQPVSIVSPSNEYSTQGNNVPYAYEPYAPPTGAWKDGLCDCFTNLWPSCGCFYFCYGAWLVAQMSQKTGFMSFKTIFVPFLVFWIIFLIISAATGLGGLILIPEIGIFVLAIFLRLHFTAKYRITTYPWFVEVLIGFFCSSCSICQMARHLYGYRKVFDGDSDIEGGMSYHHPSPPVTSIQV